VKIATNIFTESVQGGATSLIQLTRELHPLDVQQWFALPSAQLDEPEAFRDWATQTCQKFKDTWEGLYHLRRSAYHSLFPDVAIFRKRVVNGFRNNCGDARTMADWATRLLTEAEHNPSPIYKINTVLTLLEWARPVTNAGGNETETKEQERQFWRNISPGGRSKRPQRRASELLSDALQPTALSTIGETLGGMISLVWLEKENLTTSMRRYYAAMVGGFLVTQLVEADVFQSEKHRLRIQQDLLQIESRDDAPGLFRPVLARYLRYPLAFAVHQLRGYESTVQTYLMTDDLRKQFLDIGGWYRVVSGFLGDAETLKPIWLDAALEQSPTAGVDTFLRNSAGASFPYWQAEDKQRLERLAKSTEFDHDREISALFEQITNNPKDAEVLPILQHLSFFISLGVHTRPLNLGEGLLRCLDAPVVTRLARSQELYRFFILNFAGVILIEELDNEAKLAFRDLLLASHDKLHSPEQLIAHAHGIVFLLQMNWRDDAVGEWLNTVAKDETLPLELRRLCVAAFTEVWHQFPVDVKTQLEPVLINLAQSPPWDNLTETIFFRRTNR
jgi:hypothetical protein